MNTKHTPGPWKVSTDMRGLGNVRVAGVETETGFSIANCGTHGEANARLIASAPDLLAALIELEKVESSPHSETVRFLAREQAREAIARATGAA